MSRLLVAWMINAGCLLVLPLLIPAVHLEGLATALLVALLLGLLNAVLRPILVLLTLPITVLSLGLFLLVINGLMFWMASRFVEGFTIDGFGWAILGAVVYSLLTGLVGSAVLGPRVQRLMVLAAGVALSAALCLLPAAPVAAQTGDFPSRPVRVIVPFPAGGTADVLPRLMSERLRARLGQNVVVENRPGAGGNIGAEAIYRAEADGHWLLASPPGPLAVNQSLYARLNYDPAQFEAVTVLAQVPTVLVVGANSRYASVRDFVEAARARPEQLSFASQGNGSTSHLTTFLFQSATGTRLIHVPYKGTAPALTDLMGGQVDIFFDNLGSSLPLHRAGKVRILAVADARRSPVIPEIPTLAEAGVSGVQSSAWFGVVAPPGTPEPVVRKLSGVFAEVLRSPEVAQRFSEQGAVPVGGTPEQTRAFLRDEAQKWRKIIQDARVTLD